jgi:hypothetical protein
MDLREGRSPVPDAEQVRWARLQRKAERRAMWGTLLIGLVGMALSQLLKPTLNAHPWLAVLMLLGIAVCTLVLFAIAMARLGE